MKTYKVLNDELKKYCGDDYYPFHMPGHKRNPACVKGEFSIDRDITEIEGFDNLHHAEDILEEVQKKAAEIYGVKHTFYSINGSTAALLSAISASVKRNGKIIMARNCHKAVYHAVYLRNLYPVYLYPQFAEEFGINGGILPEDVDNLLKNNPDTEAVLLTSPTYDGIVSDIGSIAEICHKYGVTLIVDEAHGAHFRFSDYFPVSAAELGADLVIQSVHKTLPAMTQTALLHQCSERVKKESLQMFMGIYQSSSPSYILMASIDSCMEKLKYDKREMFDHYCSILDETRTKLDKLNSLHILKPDICGKYGIFDYDKSKILIFTDKIQMNGKELHEILLKIYHLEMEMDAEHYVTALTSVGDSEEGMERLVRALEEIDKKYSGEEKYKDKNFHPYTPLEQIKTLGDALEGESCQMNMVDCEGKISAEFAYLYPPGIPILVPGEKITEELIKNMQKYREAGLSLQGLRDYSNKTIYVVKE